MLSTFLVGAALAFCGIATLALIVLIVKVIIED